METLALIILVTLGLIGFIMTFFTAFGTLIILIGAVAYGLMTNFGILDTKVLLVLLTLYLGGEILEYVFVIAGAKKFGASNPAIAGAIVGGVLGAILGAGVLGLGAILSVFLGIFLGAFLVEYASQKDLVKSLKAGLGGVLGRVGSIIAKVIVAIVMLTIVILKMR